jgi:GAF domain-containing protein
MVACEFSVVLRSNKRDLYVIAASSEAARLIDERQLEDGQGPLLAALELADGVLALENDKTDAQWPRFGSLMRSIGFGSVCVIPLRTESGAVGVLNAYCREGRAIPEGRMDWICTLAGGAAQAVGNNRSGAELKSLTQQLQFALSSRILIEQAKGQISAKTDSSVDEAFELLRSYSRGHNRSIHEVAEDVIANRISMSDLRTPRVGRV